MRKWLLKLILPIALSFSEESRSCTNHGECLSSDEFCSRVPCLESVCGICRPLSQCYCDDDSIDKRCPFPGYPTFAVRYLQGVFRNRSVIANAPDYECFRRLVVTGNIFSMLQFPVLAQHPASKATLRFTEEVFSECSAFIKNGVFDKIISLSSDTVNFKIMASSEGSEAP